MEFELSQLKFYPYGWQSATLPTINPWLTHMTIWHYWLWFTFMIGMYFYFIYLMKTLSYNRADMSGLRANGEKSSNSWSEMIMVIFPIYWAVNIMANAFTYLSITGGGHSYTPVTIQITGYQWGWKYCYNDAGYLTLTSDPVELGYELEFIPGGHMKNKVYNLLDYDMFFHVEWKNLTKKFMSYAYEEMESTIFLPKIQSSSVYTGWLSSYMSETELSMEVYYKSFWLKFKGILENESNKPVKNSLYHTGYWIVAQGVEPNQNLVDSDLAGKNTLDPLSLLHSTGALVLPTRVNIRFLASSEDMTHSWAVPGLGMKMDCVPGRLFCFVTNMGSEGVYFGQCSELCGWNHYNMPIIVYGLPIEHFMVWWEIEFHALFLEQGPKNDYYPLSNSYKKMNVKYK